MSAVMLSAASQRGLLARAGSLFWQGATPTTRWIVAGLVVALGVAELAIDGFPTLFLGSLVLWWLWMPRLAMVQQDAWQTRMPGITKEVALVMLLAAIPALVFVFSGHQLGEHSNVWWLSITALTMAIGVIGSFLSFFWLSLLNFGFMVIATIVLRLSRSGMLPKDAFEVFVKALIGTDLRLALLSVTVCLVAAVLWRRFVRQGAQRVSWFHTPLILLSNDRNSGGLLDMKKTGMLSGYDPLSMWMMRQSRRYGPDSPTLAMRTLIGTPFSPLTRQQIVLQALGTAILPYLLTTNGLLGAATNHDASGSPWAGSYSGAFVVFVLLYLMHAYRLRQLMRQQAGERAELALLPGWGGADAARTVLMRGMLQVWRNAMLTWGALLVIGIASAWDISDVSPQDWGLCTLLFVEANGFVVVMCLLWLAGCRFAAWVESAIWLMGALLPAATLIWFGNAGHLTWPWLIAANLAMLVTWLIVIRVLWRCFKARPHPFLQV